MDQPKLERLLRLMQMMSSNVYKLGKMQKTHEISRIGNVDYLSGGKSPSSKGHDYDGDGFEHPDYDEDGEW